MVDEPKKDHPEDIASILSDLDAILTGAESVQDAGGTEPAQPALPPQVELPMPAPRKETVNPPKPVELPKPAEPPKAVEPPKPVEPSKPVEPPKPAEAPKSASPAPVPVAPSAPEEMPANTTKEQIRRVAYVHTFASAEAEKGFAAFLGQAARTISKKPLFLREVLSHEVGDASDPDAILEKAQQVKAVALLAVVEDWPSAKIDELAQACSRAGLLFRAVAPAEAQKKSTAVDIIVDMMLLPGEV